jgi:hypothetical protein
MYVVYEKAFDYAAILCLKVPTKKDLKKILIKNNLKYSSEDLDQTIVHIMKDQHKHATTIMYMDPGIAIIVFYRWEGDALDYGALSHELFHVVDLNLRAKGITLSDDSDETYAHHLGYFTKEFLNQIWK